jgi:hypothetical protein
VYTGVYSGSLPLTDKQRVVVTGPASSLSKDGEDHEVAPGE